MESRTIVALATPPGDSGLAVVRLSGPEVLTLAEKVFTGARPLAETGSHRAVYGILKWPISSDVTHYDEGDVVDEVVVLPQLAPHSSTGEDTLEIFCHGGHVVARNVVAACCAAGAEPATAGEFTRRAFLNGKLSLDQAEAVADLIHAESTSGARAAVGQLRGGLNRQLDAIERPLLNLLARIEGSLEFVTEEDVAVPVSEMRRVMTAAHDRIGELLELTVAGRLLRDGIQVVLVGAPNVGKSSLFNALLQQERALVDDQAGTTRDVVSARVVHQGTVYEFHDTAGLRDGGGRVEQLGMDRTRRQAETADIVLDLRDVTDPAGEGRSDETPVAGPVSDGDQTLDPVSVCDSIGGAQRISVLTKCDLWPESARTGREIADKGAIATSSRTGQGVDRIWRRLEAAVDHFGLREAMAQGVVINDRHRHKLEHCRRGLGELLADLGGGIDDSASVEESNIGEGAGVGADAPGGVPGDVEPLPGDEVVGTALAAILCDLGEVTGRVFSEHLLDAVFSRFCVGK